MQGVLYWKPKAYEVPSTLDQYVFNPRTPPPQLPIRAELVLAWQMQKKGKGCLLQA